jgi:hypothetical protein
MWDSLDLDFKEEQPAEKKEEELENLKGRRLTERLNNILREEALKNLKAQKQK